MPHTTCSEADQVGFTYGQEGLLKPCLVLFLLHVAGRCALCWEKLTWKCRKFWTPTPLSKSWNPSVQTLSLDHFTHWNCLSEVLQVPPKLGRPLWVTGLDNLGKTTWIRTEWLNTHKKTCFPIRIAYLGCLPTVSGLVFVVCVGFSRQYSQPRSSKPLLTTSRSLQSLLLKWLTPNQSRKKPSSY